MDLPQEVFIVEVGARDGLQNVPKPLTVADKLRFIELLTAAGLKEIEAGAFVNPRRVPQMADSDKVFTRLKGKGMATGTGVVYSALVPNEHGMAAAMAAGVKKIAVFTAASETFNQKNIGCSLAESIRRFEPVLKLASAAKIAVRGYVSTAFVCPYEGEIAPGKIFEVVTRLADLGISDISIGDTIGKATPAMVAALLALLLRRFQPQLFAMHLHDTFGAALANVQESLQHGIVRYDASTGGLGGCPFAPGASGNVSTNALVRFFSSQGIATGVDIAKLDEAAHFIIGVLGGVRTRTPPA